MEITHIQRKEFFALCRSLNIDKDSQRQLIWQHTNGKTASVASGSTMTKAEMNNLLKWLRKQKQGSVDETVSLRRKVISLLHQLGWETATGKVDWSRFNRFLASPNSAVAPKHLNNYQKAELHLLKKQLEGILKQQQQQEAEHAVKQQLL